MKKLLRKATSILCVLALLLSYAGVVSFAEANPKEGNLALSGTMIADSEQGPGDGKTFYAANANDSDTSTRWQSTKKGNGGEDAWIGCTWSTAQTISILVLEWETAHPSTNGFRVETSDNGETWTPVVFTNVRSGSGDDHQVDTITLTQQATTRYIRVYCFEAYVTGGNTKEQPSCYEFEAYAEEVHPFDVAAGKDVLKRADYAYAESGVSALYTDASWSAYQTARTNLDNAVKACGGKNIGEVDGYADQAAFDACVTALLTAELGLKLKTASDNLLYRGILFWGSDVETGWSSGISPCALTDGRTKRNDPRNQSNWQKSSKGGEFVLVLTEPAEINRLTVYCENDSAKYEVSYVASFDATDFTAADKLTVKNGTVTFDAVPGSLSWTKISDLTESARDKSSDPKSVTMSFNTVKVAALKFKSTNNGAWVSEVEARNLTGTPYNVSDLASEKTTLDKAFDVKKNTYGYSAESWSAFTEAYGKAVAAIDACKDKTVGTVDGYETQEDIDDLLAALQAAAANLTGDGDVKTNRLENGIMIYDPSDMQSYAGDNNLRTLTDGKKANDSNAWQPKTAKGSVVYLKLNNPAELNKVVLYVESASEEYAIAYTTDDVAGATYMADMADLTWEETDADRIADFDVGSSIAYQLYTFAAVKDVTAIRLTCTQDNRGYCKLREVEAYGVQAGKTDYAPCFADQIQLESKASSGESGKVDRLIVTNVDKDCFALRSYVMATYTIERDGKSGTGSVAITEAWSGIRLSLESQSTTLTYENVGGQDDHYVVGLLLADVLSTDKITVTFSIEEMPEE